MKRSSLRLNLSLLFAFCLLLIPSLSVAWQNGDTIYVDTNAHGNGSGLSWSNAFTTIQGAIDSVSPGTAVNIFVAHGLYLEHNLILQNGIKLYGSFEGDESSLEERRDVWTNDHWSVIDAERKHRVLTMGDRSEVNGFILRNGLRDYTLQCDTTLDDSRGGGIYITCDDDIVVRNNIIEDCAVFWQGGGIFIEGSCNNTPAAPLIEFNVIRSCTGYCGGGIEIAGVPEYAPGGTDAIIRHNVLRNNTDGGNSELGFGLELWTEYEDQCSPRMGDFYNNIITGFWNKRDSSIWAEDVHVWARNGIDRSFISTSWSLGEFLYDGCYRYGNPDHYNIFGSNPMFVDEANSDYHLRAGSPCIGAGRGGVNIGLFPYNGDIQPPVISGVASSGITSSGATITWSTNEASDSQVQFGLTTSYGSTTSLNPSLVTSHSVSLSGLSANTTYHYRVKSKDGSGNLATSQDYNFTTASSGDTTPPVISSVSSSGITSNAATITWSTNEVSDSQVEYGLTTGYGTSTPLNTGLVTNHAVILSGLSASATYHYRVKSKDAAANLTVSGDYSFMTSPQPPGGWDGYGYRRALTLDFTKVTPCSSNLTNFPVLVSLSGTWLKTTANGGRIYSSNGYDIIFRASDGTTKLDHDVEKYDGSGGTLVAWVRVPMLSYTSNTIIYIYYGNSAITTYQSNPTGVWDSNYKGVWHLKENPSGTAPQLKDSTSNVNSGTSNGGMTSGDQVAAKVGGGLDLEGTDHYISAANNGSTLNVGQAFTLEAWIKRDTTGPKTVMTKRYGGAYSFKLSFTSSDVLRLDVYNGSGYNNVQGSTISDSNWHHVGAYVNGTSLKLFTDGVVHPNAGTKTGTIPYDSNALYLGAGMWSGTPRDLFDGIIDEMRISNVVRSECWIKTGYLNQNSPSTFYATGNEEIYAPEDTQAPVISSVASSGITSGAATITWSTNEVSDSQVEYGLTTSYGSSTPLDSSAVTKHSVTFSGLSARTTYHYRVKSKDAAANLATSGDYSFTTVAPPDTTPPVISNVTGSGITSSGVTITWSTDEASDSQVEYGVTTSYGTSTTVNTALVTNHSAALTGLTTSTTYHYRVKSKDVAGNLAVSGDYSFITAPLPDTQPPVISNVTADRIGFSNATITWSTDEPADSQVEYGLTTGYGTSTTLNTSLVTNHSIVLSGLSANTYHYRVKSKDGAGNLAVSGDYTFMVVPPPDTEAPVISDVATSGVTYNAATITWSTNESADSQVEYGLDTLYGFSTPLDSNLVMNHSVILSGLSAHITSHSERDPVVIPAGLNGVTMMHYRVKSKDAAGNLAVSGDYTFALIPPPDTEPPVISSVTSTGVTSSSATITWSTDEASDSQVEYGRDTNYGSITSLYSDPVTSHSLSLSGLTAGTSYHYRVKSKDAAGNLAIGQDNTFTTAAVSTNGILLQYVQTYGNLHAGGVVATIMGDNNGNASAELLWRQAGETSFHTGHPLSRIDANHFVGSLFWLRPGTTYKVQVALSDPDGVTGSPSPVTSLVTRSEDLTEPSTRTLYVTTTGNDANSGTNPSAPLQTIQRAADLSQPGDLILIQPGAYRESVNVPRSGTASQPIVFRGSGDGVILDGADEAIAAGVTWTSVGSGVFSRITGFPTDHVVTEAGRLFRYNSLSDLQVLGAGAPGGFYFDGTKLYVKFTDGSSPATHTMQVARLEDGLVLDGVSYVRIENLEIRNYGSGGYGKGVYLRYSSDIVVRYCQIHEIERAGVWVKGGDRHRIEDNEFWDTSIFNWPWSLSKGSTAENCGIRFTDEAGRGHVMRRNTIHGTFNGIGIDSEVAPASGVTNEIDVYENIIYQQMDDAFEPEGSYTSNFRFWSNQIKDVHMAFSLAPVGIGPVWVIYNVAYRQGNTPSSLTDATFLKINNGYGTPNGPIFLYHNTVFTDVPNTDVIRIMEPAESPFIKLRNNVLSGTLYVLEIDNTVPAGSVGFDMNGDDLYTTSTTGFIKWFNNARYANLGAFRTETGQELQGLSVQPTFVNPPGGDFRLPAGSVLIDAGVVIPGINDFYVGNGPDIGAYEYGLGGDTTPPAISNVASSGITSSGATIAWSTDEASDSQVEYGLSTGYGTSTTLNTSMVTNHSVVLSGLSPSTTYHYRVKSKDTAGNLATSGDYTFTTPAPPDTTPPVISSVTSSGVTSNGATITWSTNEASDSQVEYGLSTGYGTSTTLNTSMVTNHSVVLSGLSPSTTYHYRVKSKDAAGNLATSIDCNLTTSAEGWDGYGNRRPLIIDYTMVTPCSSSLSNFPVLVSLSGTWLKTTGNGGRIYSSNGYDIIFKASDGVTQLNHEIEKYDGSAGTLVAWVKVSTLSYSANTTIYVYYGNSGVTTFQSDPTGVWDSNYKGVWHLKENPAGTAPQMKDSTSNANNGASNGVMTSGDQVTAKIGGGLDLEGTDDYINASNSGSTLNVGEAFTLEAWIKRDTTGPKTVMAKRYGGAYSFKLSFTSSDVLRLDVQNSSGSWFNVQGSTITDTNWHHVGAYMSGTSLKLFTDGAVHSNTGTKTGTIPYDSNSLWMGVGIWGGSPVDYFDGIIDEVRVSNTARSACWIGTEYRNQNNPTAFYIVGNEE